ncbi:MAG: glycosyltransferase family 39 protein [Chloroflexota bacterium]|nr:glycosyltransferase family 39 protein [Chloroflexota bacterium]
MTFTQIITTRLLNGFASVKGLRRTHPGLFWILVFTVASRFAIYVVGQPWDQEVIANTILDGDGAGYDQIARGFLNGMWISDMPWAASRTVGYPTFIAAIYLISNNAIWLVLAVQVLMNVLMVPMVYWSSKILFNSNKSGTVAAALFSLSAISVAWAARFLFTETLFTFVFLIFIMVYLRFWKRESFRWFLLFGLILGVGSIVRSALQFFLVIPLLVILLQELKVSRKLIFALGIACGLLVVISPFQALNYNQYGHYSLSTISGNMFFESVVTAKSNVDQTRRYEALYSLVGEDWDKVANPFEKSAIAKRNSIKWAMSHTGEFLTLHALGMISFLIGTEKSAYLYVIARQERPYVHLDGVVETFYARVLRNVKDIQKEYFLTPVLIIKLLIEYLFVVGGLWVLIRRKQKLLAIFFVLSIAYFIVATGHAGRAPRYKIPILPIYAILGGGGATLIWTYWQEWRTSRNGSD